MIADKGNAYLVGLDVGSTTVKGIAVGLRTGRIVWQEYQRHDTRQPEKLLEFLERMESEIGLAPGNARVFITGSGGNSIASMIGADFLASTFRFEARGMAYLAVVSKQSLESKATLVGGVFNANENGTGSLPVGSQWTVFPPRVCTSTGTNALKSSSTPRCAMVPVSFKPRQK